MTYRHLLGVLRAMTDSELDEIVTVNIADEFIECDIVSSGTISNGVINDVRYYLELDC